MMIAKPAAAILIAATLGGCSSNTKIADMRHANHGIVKRDHPIFSRDLDECGKEAYAGGITVNGQRTTDRKVANAAWVENFKKSIEATRYSGAGGLAGVQGALTVSGRLPVQAATTPQPSTSVDPVFDAEYKRLEQATWACVRNKGWSEVT